jgi:predicted hydrocarbon binding protein
LTTWTIVTTIRAKCRAPAACREPAVYSALGFKDLQARKGGRMAKEPQLKASVVSASMEFIRKELGEPALQSILHGFDSQEIAGGHVLPSDWLPERTYRDLVVATRRYLESTVPQKKPRDFLFQMGRYMANDGINKYYKPLIKMFDMNFMLTKSALLWGVMHTHGSVKAEPIGKTGAYIYFSDFPAPCKETCWMLAGYMYAIGELSKARMVRVEELECVTEGAKRCKYIGEWK